MTEFDDIDWAVVDRHLAGEGNAEDAALVRRWLLAHPGLRDLLDRAPAVVANHEPEPALGGWDTDRAFGRISKATSHPNRPRSSRAVGTGVGPLSTGWIAIVTGGLTVGILGVILALGTRGRSQGAAMRHERQYATAAGQRLTVTLGDGTQFTLAPQSRLSVPATYGRDARDVQLEGEAAFTVVHDAARPFAVHTRTAIARDVGTVFDVQAYAEDSATRVAVLSGRVALAGVEQTARETAIIDGGQVAEVERGHITMLPEASANRLTAWTTDELTFDNTPVADVARVLSRWYDLDVVVADSAVAREHLTATYVHEPADRVLQLVARALGAKVEQQGRTVVLR